MEETQPQAEETGEGTGNTGNDSTTPQHADSVQSEVLSNGNTATDVANSSTQVQHHLDTNIEDAMEEETVTPNFVPATSSHSHSTLFSENGPTFDEEEAIKSANGTNFVADSASAPVSTGANRGGISLAELESHYESEEYNEQGFSSSQNLNLPGTPMRQETSAIERIGTPGSQLSAVDSTPGRGGLSQGWVSISLIE